MTLAEKIDDCLQRIARVESQLALSPVPIPDTCPRNRWRNIVRWVGGRYGFSEHDITCHARHAHLVWARQVAMELSCELIPISARELAALFERDHTMIAHACRNVRDRCEIDPDRRREVNELRAQLLNSINSQTH